MTLHSPRHLDVVAIVRSDEVGADQQQDDLIAVDVFVDGSIDLLASIYASIMPSVDNPLPPEHRKLLLKLISQRLVSVTV